MKETKKCNLILVICMFDSWHKDQTEVFFSFLDFLLLHKQIITNILRASKNITKITANFSNRWAAAISVTSSFMIQTEMQLMSKYSETHTHSEHEIKGRESGFSLIMKKCSDFLFFFVASVRTLMKERGVGVTDWPPPLSHPHTHTHTHTHTPPAAGQQPIGWQLVAQFLDSDQWLCVGGAAGCIMSICA